MPQALALRLRARCLAIYGPFSLCALLTAAAVAAIAPPASAASFHAPLQLRSLSSSALYAHRTASTTGTASANTSSQPLSPEQIRRVYALPASGAANQTIAVVSVYNDPHIQRDLDAYDQYFGLRACTESDRCLRVLNQSGRPSPLPPSDPSGGQWITESSVGVELAHGICQSCRILLVEADTTYKGDVALAAKAAAGAGATVVTTSITPVEDSYDSQYEKGYFTQPHTAMVAAAGDAQNTPFGYGSPIDFPASLPDVLAVGGTDLTLAGHGGYGSEQAWQGSVSGCSQFNPAPAWQKADAAKVGCGTHRAVADLSAMAEPGAIVHVTGTDVPGGPWYSASGTSVSAPIIASVIALAGSLGSREAETLYARERSDPGAFHDIVRGSNYAPCSSPICQAGPGYDGPTGLGTPDGLAAFLLSGGALAPRAPMLSVLAPHGLYAGRAWTAHPGLRNGNSFAVRGTIVLRRTLRIDGRLRTIRFAIARVSLGPLAQASQALHIDRGERALLGRLHTLTAWVFLHARGPAGRYVTIKRSVQLHGP